MSVHVDHRPAAETVQPDTVARVMRPAATTVEQDAHIAAAAYLMRHAEATAIVVIDDEDSRRPVGILTEADILRVVADGKDPNDMRIRDLMTSDPTVCQPTTSIRDAAQLMNDGRFRHLPVTHDEGVVGMVDISDVSRALLDTPG